MQLFSSNSARPVLEPQAPTTCVANAAADAGVMAFSEVMADSSALGRFSLELYDSGRCMRLDAAAQRALNVMRQRTDANDAFSLYGLMNRARTAMAKRLLKVRSSIALSLFVELLTAASADLHFWNSRHDEPAHRCQRHLFAHGLMSRACTALAKRLLKVCHARLESSLAFRQAQQ